jgi:hypothetical protein
MSGFLNNTSPQGFDWLLPIDLTGSVGTINTNLLTMPPNFNLIRVIITIKTALVGGTETIAIGTSSGGETILTPQSIGSINTLLGDLYATQLGTDMLETRGYEAFYPSATSIWIKRVISGGTITAGSATLYLAGYST